MTKGGGLPFGARGHHIADFHLRISDHDTINESCHQWSAWGKGQGVECRRQTWTKRLDSLGQGYSIAMLLGLGIALSQLRRSAMVCWDHLLAFPLALCPFDDLREVSIAP